MVFTSYRWFMSLHCCWILTTASDNFNEIHIQQLEGKVLRISCNITNGPSDSLPITMSIFADTPNNTLVSVSSKKCPKVQGSVTDRHIYLPECVPQDGNLFLDIVLTNYNPVGNEQFGCNYTCSVDSQISHSLSHATVYNVDNTSHAASNETGRATAQDMLGVNEGTTSTTERDDKPIVVHGGTCGGYDTTILAQTTFISACLLLMIVIVLIVCLKRCRRVSSHRTAQEKSQTLDYSKDSELGTLRVCTQNNKANKHDNYHECIPVVVHDLPSEGVKNKEEYKDEYPYTQVVKVHRQETSVHKSLLD